MNMTDTTRALPLSLGGFPPAAAEASAAEARAQPAAEPAPAAAPPAPQADGKRQRERRRRLRKLLKRGLLLSVAALLTLALVQALLPDPIPVEVATVADAPLQVTVDESGRTRVKDRFLVSAPVSGRIARIALRPGDVVPEGGVVAVVTPLLPPLLDGRTRAEMETRVAAARFAQGQAQAAVERGTTSLRQAQLESERMQRLYTAGAVTAVAAEQAEFARLTRADELASAEFGARVADEELRRARTVLARPASGGAALESVEVRSPVAGRVLRVPQENEGVVQAGTPLLEIGDPRALEVVIDVLTADAVAIVTGARVSIESWGGAEPLTGRVRRVEPAAFVRISALGVEEQRVNVLVDLEGPRQRWSALGDGFRVEARIVLWESGKTLVVPSAAVVRTGGGWSVYRLEDARARLRPVTLGHRNARDLEVASGLQAGDRVVLYPGDQLADGKEVTVRPRR
jgi:HlyD family secretion protein